MRRGQAPTVEIVRADAESAKEGRYMFDKIHMKAGALKARVEALGEAMLAANPDMPPVQEDMLGLTQEVVTVLGRVCCEKGAMKLTKDTVAIECVHEDGAERARLDVHQLDGFSLFPGQVPVP